MNGTDFAPTNGHTSLAHYLARMWLERDVSDRYKRQVRHRMESYSEHLGWPARLDDLTHEAINAWIESLQQRGYKPRTVRHYRDAVVGIWRDAFERGEIARPPQRIKRIRVPQHIVEAWTLDELQRLLVACKYLRDCVTGTPICKRDWMRALIHVCYSGGYRMGDVVNVARWSDLSGDILSIVEPKTGFPKSRRLTPRAVAALRRIEGHGLEYLLPWSSEISNLYRSFRVCVRRAGIRPGGPHRLKRSAGSIAEHMRPGAGQELLGHRDVRMFDRHYHDRRISARVPDPPPEIR